MSTTRAIVLARGLGTRMRAPDPSARLTPEQQRIADAGLKAMIPLNGRPFLDYILSSLADAGIRDVALVVAPEHDALRRYYESDAPPSRVRVGFVVQDHALGTANAVLASERWVQCEPFLTMNADNLYPVDALAALAALAEPGLPAFDPEDLMRSSNIAAERLRSFAFLETDDRGYLTGIVEKPNKVLPPNRLRPDSPSFGRGYGESAEALSASARRAPARPRRGSKSEVGAKAEGGSSISMNCWRFDERIFQACREVPRSARGEFEIPEAVGVAVRRGMPFKTFPARGPVLDLSTRADADDVARRLAGISPRP